MSIDSSKINLLLVDDHHFVIEGLKSMLATSARYCVKQEATNGHQALDCIAQNPDDFQLVITDISMPLMTGIQLCERIKETYPHIKVLILSMHNSHTIVKDAIKAEADGYMLKNTGKDEFILGIERIMENGTYFSQDILPIIMSQFQKERSTLHQNSLSIREKEVLNLIVKEFTSREIAEKLFISKQTVDTHRNNIMQKTGCKTLVGLIKYAVQMPKSLE